MDNLGTLQALGHAITRYGQAPALIAVHNESTETRSFAQLAEHSRQLAAGLGARGICRGDAVAIISASGPDWITAAFAVFAAGAVLVPLDPLLGDEELALQLRDSGCRMVFVTESQLGRLSRIATTALPSPIFLDGAGDEPGRPPHWRTMLVDAPFVADTVSSDDVAALFYTSGTTGRPKGVPLTHGNLVANLKELCAAFPIAPGDRVLVPLPLHHVYPLVVGALAPLIAGVAVAFPGGLSGPEIAHALRVSEASVLIGVPRLYSALLAAILARLAMRGRLAARVFGVVVALAMRLPRHTGQALGRLIFRRLRATLSPRLRLLISGGARLNPEHWCRLEALGWTVLNGYGLTETAPILTFNTPAAVRIGTAGRPLAGVELRLQNVGEDRTGEILARGPNVFGGYHNLLEETSAAFTPDGWFKTGDIGFIDDEGYLHIEGRGKELIVLPDGKNVFPESVEAAYGNIAVIREMAALEREGELVALVVPDLEAARMHGAESLDQLMRDELVEASLTLPGHHRIAKHVLTRNPLPRTTIGKLRRHKLPELYAAACDRTVPPPVAEPSVEDRILLATPPAGDVWTWLQQRFPASPLSLDTSPQLDLGIDSLAWTGLSLEIEDRFGVCLGERRIAGIVTLRDLLRETVAAAAEAPVLPEAERWSLPSAHGPLLRFLFSVLYCFNRGVIRALFRLRVTGLDQLPSRGPYVIAANHTSYLDPLVIAAALPLETMRHVYFGGSIGVMFRGPLSRAISRLAHVFPIDPYRAAAGSLDLAQDVLLRSGILIWFPEGTRSLNGALQRFLPGIGVVLQEHDIPVVPARITGTFEAAPRGRMIPRLRLVHLAFGAAASPSHFEKQGKGDTAAARIADGLHRAVAAAGGQEQKS